MFSTQLSPPPNGQRQARKSPAAGRQTLAWSRRFPTGGQLAVGVSLPRAWMAGEREREREGCRRGRSRGTLVGASQDGEQVPTWSSVVVRLKSWEDQLPGWLEGIDRDILSARKITNRVFI